MPVVNTASQRCTQGVDCLQMAIADCLTVATWRCIGSGKPQRMGSFPLLKMRFVISGKGRGERQSDTRPVLYGQNQFARRIDAINSPNDTRVATGENYGSISHRG